MRVFDNVHKTVKDDLTVTLEKGSKLAIAAACFSIYVYQALKKQLESVDELRFIFTSPTFVAEKAPKEKREFYIPRLNRERSLYGTGFEIKLRNELSQKAIARECAAWISKKAKFMSNVSSENMSGFLNVITTKDQITYLPLNGFTTVDIDCEHGCILADSVGLGKTFTALAVIKYYEDRNRNVLVLCPKKLSDNWRTFRENYTNNPIAADRLRDSSFTDDATLANFEQLFNTYSPTTIRKVL